MFYIEYFLIGYGLVSSITPSQTCSTKKTHLFFPSLLHYSVSMTDNNLPHYYLFEYLNFSFSFSLFSCWIIYSCKRFLYFSIPDRALKDFMFSLNFLPLVSNSDGSSVSSTLLYSNDFYFEIYLIAYLAFRSKHRKHDEADLFISNIPDFPPLCLS